MAGAASTVSLGIFSPSVVLDLARSSGRLADRGIAVREEAVSSSPAQFRSLLGGEYDAVLTNPDNVLAYRFSPSNPLGATADVRIVSAVDRGLGLGLYAAPGRSIDDLRGGVAAVDVPGSGFALILFALARELGVERTEYAVSALGSTPRRRVALAAGECDVTMLNAGNELVAEREGCVRLGVVDQVVSPYLGTVLTVAGRPTAAVLALSDVLDDTVAKVLAGELDEPARASAERLLGLDPESADRYVAGLKDPVTGLVADGRADAESLEAVIGLRQQWLPEPAAGGGDVLDAARGASSGLLVDR